MPLGVLSSHGSASHISAGARKRPCAKASAPAIFCLLSSARRTLSLNLSAWLLAHSGEDAKCFETDFITGCVIEDRHTETVPAIPVEIIVGDHLCRDDHVFIILGFEPLARLVLSIVIAADDRDVLVLKFFEQHL